MQGKSLYAILLSIIAVLALALAVLVIFLFTTYSNIKDGAAEATPKPTEGREVIPIDEQVQFNLYTNAEGIVKDAIFNVKPSPAHDDSHLMASISIVYDAGPKKEKLEDRKSLIEQTHLSKLKQACITYFRSQTYEQLSEEAAIEKASDALKDIFNSILEADAKDKIIISVIFDNWIIE